MAQASYIYMYIALPLGTSHYLWLGGAESKLGGGCQKYFEVQRIGIEKKLGHEWA